jgi:hypothetical protein
MNSLPRWLDPLQSLAVVAFLSVLLWTWADQQLRAPAEFDFIVEIKSGDRGVAVRLGSRAVMERRFTVHVRVEGPQKAVADLKAEAESGRPLLTYQVPSDELFAEIHTIRVADWLRGVELFRERGIAVQFASPNLQEIELDGGYELPVVVADKDGRPLDDVVLTVVPDRLTARTFRAVYEGLRDKYIKAVLDRSALLTGDSRPQVIEAPVVPPPGVRLETLTVRVSASLKTKTRTLENLPIHVCVADPAYWRDYVPEIDPRSFKVLRLTVQGPADVIDTLRPEDVFAFVVVGKSNTEESPLDTEIQFRLPKGVELAVRNSGPDRSPDPPRIKCPLKKRSPTG